VGTPSEVVCAGWPVGIWVGLLSPTVCGVPVEAVVAPGGKEAGSKSWVGAGRMEPGAPARWGDEGSDELLESSEEEL